MNEFPTDVRLEVDGEYSEAVYGVARTALFKTMQRAELSPDTPVVTSVQIDDNTFVSASVMGDIKTVVISNKPPGAQQEFEEPAIPPPDKAPPRELPYMLSGWTKDAAVAGGVLNTFRPDPVCAKAYNLREVFQGSKKLGTAVPPPQQLKWPSMFSGAMKRYVEASMGLGEIRELAVGGVPVRRTIPVSYSPTWYKTHGLIKFGPKKHWLVEISDTNGVLVRPLPLLHSTTLPSFRARMVIKGDTDTIRVLDEFGGLPDGTTFPTGTELTTALAAGTVRQLLTKAQLKAFYEDGSAYPIHYNCGWAFSENGVEAHNVMWAFRDPFTDDYQVRSKEYAANPPDSVSSLQYYTASGQTKWFEMNTDHCKITFSLGDPTDPYALTTASLTRVHRGKFLRWMFEFLFVPLGVVSEPLAKQLALYPSFNTDIPRYAPWIDGQAGMSLPGTPLGCIAHVFFDGDYLRRVKWWAGDFSGPDPILGGGSGWGQGFWTDQVDMRAPWVSDTAIHTSSSVHLILSDLCREGYQMRRVQGWQTYGNPIPTYYVDATTYINGRALPTYSFSAADNDLGQTWSPSITPDVFARRTGPPGSVSSATNYFASGTESGFATNGAKTEYLIYDKLDWTLPYYLYYNFYGQYNYLLPVGGYFVDAKRTYIASTGLPVEVRGMHPRRVNWIGATP